MTKRLIVSVVMLSCVAYSQTWSGIVASSRAIRWDQNAGLPATLLDGETTSSAWNPPIRSTICTTLGTAGQLPTFSQSVTAAQAGTAFQGCSSAVSGSRLRLNPGTYTWSTGEADLYGKNVTLSCNGGPMDCIVKLTGGTVFMGRHSTAGSSAITAGLTQGSTSITLTSASGFTSGNIIQIYQCDAPNSGNPCSLTVPTDNGGLWICGFASVCNIDGGSGVYRDQQQTVLVTNVAGNVLTISPGLYMSNWSTSLTATAERNDFSSFPCQGLGIENITFYTPHNGGGINRSYCYASWMVGNRFIGSNTDGGNSVVEYEGDMRSLFSNNYIYGIDPASPNVSNYVFIEPQRESDNLWLNNIYQVTAYRGLGHLEGDVIAYDYHRDTLAPNAAGFEENGDFQHFPGVAYVLREGNQQGVTRDDPTWGTHDLDTWFRNYIECYDVPFFNTNSTSLGVSIGQFSRFENFVGGVFGSKDSSGSNTGCVSYQSTSNTAVYVVPDGGADTLTTASLMRWGNVTTITQVSDTPTNSGVRFVSSEVPSALASPNAALSNPVPGNTTLPASFFMSATAHPNGGTGLSWWKTCTNWSSFPSTCGAYTTPPFPTAGPDVTGGPYVNGFAYDNPAYLAWLNLPTDTTWQNSYTVTGSSWSGGTETLTVTIAAGWHIQGGFTPPAWNSACNPSSGLSFTGRTDKEILMTASSSTTISYALTGNPGLSCTGTIKWPDVRQFDAAVYQVDNSLSPSANLQGSVKAAGAVVLK